MADRALATAVAAIAGEAGRMALARWRTDVHRWEKAPNNPVSEVDMAVDALLRDRLTALLPDAGWLSEESADDRSRLARRRVWIVDPIDGTRDFLRERPGWCVSVALVEDGRPVIAVLDAPACDERWIALENGGATRNGVPLRVASRTDLAGARVPIDTLPRADRDLVAVSKPNSIALRIAAVAAGDADLVATQRTGAEWDIAAAALIAAEAGACITDGSGGPILFNKRVPEASGVLVCAPGIHAAAVARFGARASSPSG